MRTKLARDLVWELARDAGRNPDPAAGTVTMTAADEAQLVNRLNAGLRWCWEYYTGFSLSQTIDEGSVTLATGAVIEAAEIDNGDRFSIWSENPRPLERSQLNRVRLRGRMLANGDVLVPEGAAGQAVYVFWQVPPTVISVAGLASQTVPDALARAAVLWANYERLLLETSLPANAQRIRDRAEEEIERLGLAARTMDGELPPWLVYEEPQ